MSAAAAGGQSAEEGVSDGSSSSDGEAPEYTPAQEAAAGQRLYLVQPGDTLYGICLECYGDGSRMDEICRLNGLEDVDKITAGQNLILP